MELTVFSVLSCLGSGALFFQGLLAARYRGERTNAPVAGLSIGAIVVAMVFFAMRLGHWERLFGGFANATSGITLLLYAAVALVVAAALLLAMSLRAEDGSVPAWCGAVAAVVSVAMMAATAFGSYYYVRVDSLTADFWALALACAGFALTMGCGLALALGAAVRDGAAVELARKALAPCVAVAAAGVVVYLLVFQLGADETAAASKSVYSMSAYSMNVNGFSTPASEPDDVVSLVLTGANAPVFWGGVVVAGLAVPLACGCLALTRAGAARDAEQEGEKGRAVPVAAGAVALAGATVGAVALRAVIAALGV